MKPLMHLSTLRRRLAFTLIELLVVIAIIAILAGLLLPAAMFVKNKSALKRAESELGRVEHAIATYKIDMGFYPPDNKVDKKPVLPVPNSLYYELTGVNIQDDRETFISLDGGQTNTADELQIAFNTGGINNAGIEGSTEGPVAKNYLPELKSAQHVRVKIEKQDVQILGTSIDGPFMYGTVNPFFYVSSNPTNNPESFDLWADVIVGGKTNRISNWKEQPEIVAY